MIFDSHCHYNLDPLQSNWQQHWQTAQEYGVTDSLVVGVNQLTSQIALDIAKTDQHLFAAIGIHPTEWQDAPDLNLDQALASFEKMIAEEKVVAIGETGLDYYWLKNNSSSIKDLQKKSLIAHLAFAAKAQLPTILHVRDKEIPEERTEGNAYWDTLNILLKYKQPNQAVILHCVSGPLAYIAAALDLGAFVGVAGNVTYKNADHIRNIVKLAPPEKILLETDAPFLPPQNHRGKTCEPWMIGDTAAFVKDYIEVNLETIYQTTASLLLTKQ